MPAVYHTFAFYLITMKFTVNVDVAVKCFLCARVLWLDYYSIAVDYLLRGHNIMVRCMFILTIPLPSHCKHILNFSKIHNPRLRCWWFNNFPARFSEGHFVRYCSKLWGTTYNKFWEDIVIGNPSACLTSDMLLYFETRAHRRWLGSEMEAKFRTFDSRKSHRRDGQNVWVNFSCET